LIHFYKRLNSGTKCSRGFLSIYTLTYPHPAHPVRISKENLIKKDDKRSFAYFDVSV